MLSQSEHLSPQVLGADPGNVPHNPPAHPEHPQNTLPHSGLRLQSMLSTHPQGGVQAVFITSPKGAVFEAPWAALILKAWEGTSRRQLCVWCPHSMPPNPDDKPSFPCHQ